MAPIKMYGYRKHNPSSNMLQFIIQKEYIPAKNRFDNRLKNAENKKGELKLLEISIDYHYKKRTLDQNSLMWSLYTIEAYAHNAGLSGAREHLVTAKELYENDIREYAPVVTIECKTEHYEFVRQEYRRVEILEQDAEKTKVSIWITTSHFNTKQMAYWIDRILNRMAYFGIPAEKEAELHKSWRDWRQMLNDENISLHDEVLTGKEYKEAVPICEATGIFLGHEGGSLAHIVARGMGGNPEDWKDEAGNWLHLSDIAHALFDNGKGREHFLEEYPHLRNKIESALKKEIPVKEDLPDIY